MGQTPFITAEIHLVSAALSIIASLLGPEHAVAVHTRCQDVQIAEVLVMHGCWCFWRVPQLIPDAKTLDIPLN